MAKFGLGGFVSETVKAVRSHFYQIYQRVCQSLGQMLWAWLGAGLVVVILGLGLPAPGLASVHTYQDRPGQVTYRSQHSLRDRSDQAWQLVMFKRYQDEVLQGLYLRLVGFPGQRVVRSQPLTIDTGTHLRWQVPGVVDPQAKAWPPNVAQYDVEPLLTELTADIPLELTLPCIGGDVHLVVPPFVVAEWRSLD